MKRRLFLGATATTLITACTTTRALPVPNTNVLKGKRLQIGDTIGLIAPAGRISVEQLQNSVQKIEALGFKAKIGKNALQERGYLAGTDIQRATDVHEMFADRTVDGILCLRGGYGCNRILPLLDYDLIAQNPKVLIGYSDITSLCLAFWQKCNLITFHGPVGISTWNDFSTFFLKNVVMEANPLLFKNDFPENLNPEVVKTYKNGSARGILVGGNLTVLSSMIGSAYLPNFKDKILFLEEVEESPYKVDRMLMQLKLAGILDQIGGLVWGTCSNCVAKEGDISLTMEEVLDDYFSPLSLPVFSGSQIGHISHKFTLPVGALVELDADAGTLKMLESAVR